MVKFGQRKFGAYFPYAFKWPIVVNSSVSGDREWVRILEVPRDSFSLQSWCTEYMVVFTTLAGKLWGNISKKARVLFLHTSLIVIHDYPRPLLRFRRLDAGLSLQRPGFDLPSTFNLCCTQCHWDRFFPSTSVFLYQYNVNNDLHSFNCLKPTLCSISRRQRV